MHANRPAENPQNLLSGKLDASVNTSKRVLIAGGTGFIGGYLVDALVERGIVVSVLTRDPARARGLWQSGAVHIRPGDLTEPASLGDVCDGHDTVFHLAGYAHVGDENGQDDRMNHESISVSGTDFLLRAAQKAKIRRFVYASSVKAMGEGEAYAMDESTAPCPRSAYGRARLEAERLVLSAGHKQGMHTAILRLPLVYGRGNKGNIPRMIASIDQGRFPSLPKIKNRRSMVHVEDVVQALLLVADKPAANGQVFIVTDSRAYSTREIYEAMCKALGRSVPAWTVPVWLLQLGASTGDLLQLITRRSVPLTTNALEKLLGSAWYSSDKIRRLLGYVPRHTFYDALPEIVAEYRAGLAMHADKQSDA